MDYGPFAVFMGGVILGFSLLTLGLKVRKMWQYGTLMVTGGLIAGVASGLQLATTYGMSTASITRWIGVSAQRVSDYVTGWSNSNGVLLLILTINLVALCVFLIHRTISTRSNNGKNAKREKVSSL